MSWVEVRCEECDELTHVEIVYSGDPDRDDCEHCGGPLDWETSLPAEAPGPDPDSLHDRDR